MQELSLDFSDLTDIKPNPQWTPVHINLKKQYEDKDFIPFNRLHNISKCCDLNYVQTTYHRKTGTVVVKKPAKTTTDGFVEVNDKAKVKNLKKKGPTRHVTQVQIMTYNPRYRDRPKKKKHYNRYSNKNYARPKFSTGGGIRSEWAKVQEMNIMKIDTLSLDYSKELIKEFGTYYEFNHLFQTKISYKKPLMLKRPSEKPTLYNGAFKDPFLLNMIFNGEFSQDKKVFFMDEKVFSLLCTVHKTNFPLNLNFNKMGNKYALNIDPEDPSSAFAALYTYEENITGDLPESEATMTNLCVETTLIGQHFNQQCLKTNQKIEKELDTDEDFDEFMEENEVEFHLDPTKMYRYVKINLEDYVIYVRVAIDAYEKGPGGVVKPILVRTMAEALPMKWKPWAKNKNSVITKCYKNNTSKVMKWITEAYLADVENIKIAYITRLHSEKPRKHKIIGVENVQVSELSRFIGFYMNLGFSSLKRNLDGLSSITEDGEFIYNKAAYKPFLKFFQMPEVVEEDDEEEEEEQEEDGSEEEDEDEDEDDEDEEDEDEDEED